ncbi:MAG: hypothetical protein Q8P27_02740 [Candidatus Peregrinibacteria bacterium]|nr:hypothetical protein [Candidatus Peregrinibacteria bacterium]
MLMISNKVCKKYIRIKCKNPHCNGLLEIKDTFNSKNFLSTETRTCTICKKEEKITYHNDGAV